MSDIILVKVRDIFAEYCDDDENGCWGYSKRLNIRPSYQRAFCYKDKDRNLVIDTVMKGRASSLQLFNWVDNGDGTYEVIDGQQRTLSICQYIDDKFAYQSELGSRKFSNLQPAEQEAILDYELIVQVKHFDNDADKLEFFKRINKAGLEVNDQEMRNAVYPGAWLEDAKRYFSKVKGAAATKAMVGTKHCTDYMTGERDRQRWLETVLKWYGGDDISLTMAQNQHEKNAKALWRYFEDLMDWVAETFPMYRKELKGLDYGYLYNLYGEEDVDPAELEMRISELYADTDITNKAGIYYYVFDGEERHLNIRLFDDNIKKSVWEQQDHKCACCGKELDYKDARADHIKPWSKGGRTVLENCEVLCARCNLSKADH